MASAYLEPSDVPAEAAARLKPSYNARARHCTLMRTPFGRGWKARAWTLRWTPPASKTAWRPASPGCGATSSAPACLCAGRWTGRCDGCSAKHLSLRRLLSARLGAPREHSWGGTARRRGRWDGKPIRQRLQPREALGRRQRVHQLPSVGSPGDADVQEGHNPAVRPSANETPEALSQGQRRFGKLVGGEGLLSVGLQLLNAGR